MGSTLQIRGATGPESSVGAGVAPLVGTTVAGRYDLVRLIGQGGMGAVYEARHRETRKRCAVKLLLSADFARNQEMVRRFYREARACAAIESEHIVQVFDSGTDDKTQLPYMVMELLQGEDLEHISERLGPLEPAVVTRLMLQASVGLAKAHDIGIVHRDIKPANLFVTGRETGGYIVKLLDFGIAKIKMENFSQTTSAASHGLTRTGSMLGTPLFMSPEQAKGASQVDARSDVWSLGVVMYSLLSGSIPYADANSLGELLVMIITGDLPLLQDRAPWVPPELAEITHTAMSRDLSKRYANAGQLRDALARIAPNGPFVTLDMLVPISDELRRSVAQKMALTDATLLRASATRTGMAVTTGGEPAKRSGAGRATAIGAAALLVLAGGGLLAWRKSAHTAPVQATAATAIADSAPAVVSAAPSASAEVVKTFLLPVEPPGVEVFVDDVKAEPKGGAVELSGAPGSTRQVRLVWKGTPTEQVVAITQSGLVPPKLEAANRLAAAGSPHGKGGPSKTPSKGDKAADVPAKKPTKVATDTSEF